MKDEFDKSSLKSMDKIKSKENKTKVIALYLPQYHIIPENSLFWGEGYTDWIAVKNSKPLFDGHIQPKVPLDGYYYDLSKKEDIKHQADQAKKYGIDGFGIYHYWFSSDKQLLEKPAEIILKNKDIDIEFMFSWDNGSWKRSWSNVKMGNDWAPLYDKKDKQSDTTGVMIGLDYGVEEDWKKHFDYLLPFFLDDRYIKVNKKPIFSILNQDNDTGTLIKMCKYWDELARKSGFDGLIFLGKKKFNRKNIMDMYFLYEPEWSAWTHHNQFERVIRKMKNLIRKRGRLRFYDYDRIWRRIIRNAKRSTEDILCFGGFVSYDDSPRRGENGRIILKSSPSKFYLYFKQLYEISVIQNKPFLFIMAWNEWGEGSYLEPDTLNGYEYLEALMRAKSEVLGR